jgi:hypothetical protein
LPEDFKFDGVKANGRSARSFAQTVSIDNRFNLFAGTPGRWFPSDADPDTIDQSLTMFGRVRMMDPWEEADYACVTYTKEH